jgi:ABC-type polysaccharide/polyol phosphate transport system ATPase subunit
MDLLREWCNRGLLLVQGHIVAIGSIEEVIAAYEKTIAA